MLSLIGCQAGGRKNKAEGTKEKRLERPSGAQELGVADNRRERRRAPLVSLSLEQALRASDDILELLPVATCICDLDGRIVQYNRRAAEIWGRAPQPGETHDVFTAACKFYGADGSGCRTPSLPRCCRPDSRFATRRCGSSGRTA